MEDMIHFTYYPGLPYPKNVQTLCLIDDPNPYGLHIKYVINPGGHEKAPGMLAQKDKHCPVCTELLPIYLLRE